MAIKKCRMLEATVFIASGKKYCCKCKFVKSVSIGIRVTYKCFLFGLDLDHSRKGVRRTQTCLLADGSY